VASAEEELVAEPAAAAEPVAEPAPPARRDHVEQPTWRITAPDEAPATPASRDGIDPALPAAAVATPPAAAPEWPSTPQWPTAAPAIPILGNQLADRSTAALWAASARDVVSPVGPAPVAGVQPCSSCGLSLSATARFCRRCGSRQGE
jgi:hypothetical protein